MPSAVFSGTGRNYYLERLGSRATDFYHATNAVTVLGIEPAYEYFQIGGLQCESSKLRKSTARINQNVIEIVLSAECRNKLIRYKVLCSLIPTNLVEEIRVGNRRQQEHTWNFIFAKTNLL